MICSAGMPYPPTQQQIVLLTHQTATGKLKIAILSVHLPRRNLFYPLQ
jgi:hypothetical protein